MPKKANAYKLTLEQLSSMKEDAPLQDPLVLGFENHDEIFKIIHIMREENLFEIQTNR